MNIGESQAYLAEFKQDVLAEADPNLKAWYTQEFMLQPEYALGQQIQATLGRLVTGISQLVEIKTEQADLSGPVVDPESIKSVETPSPERPIILTAEELLDRWIEKKYARCHRQYTADMAAIQSKPQKSSKREYQERLAKRTFGRQLTDLSDISGEKHLALRADKLEWMASSVIEDQDVVDQVFADCAAYAEKYGAVVTSQPHNFAALLKGSIGTAPYSKEFDKILTAIFSPRYNQANFPAIHSHLAETAFHLLDNFDALEKIVRIQSLEEPFMTSTYGYEIGKGYTLGLARGDMQEVISRQQIDHVFATVRRDITDQREEPNPKGQRAYDDLGELLISEENRQLTVTPAINLQQREEIFKLVATGDTMDYDPVVVTEVQTGEELDVGVKPIKQPAKDMILGDSLFRQRMQHLAPYSYGVRVAKQLLGPGVGGLLIPLSPSITIDIFVTMKGRHSQPLAEFQSTVSKMAHREMPNILAVAARRQAAGITAFEDTGTLGIAYRPLQTNIKDGVVVLRPAIPTDKGLLPAILGLTLNRFEYEIAAQQQDKPLPTAEELRQTNDRLRSEIFTAQKRFLGRRPVKFISEELRASGLNTLSLRSDSKSGTIKGSFELNDGAVELTMDQDFRIQSPGNYDLSTIENLKQQYENVILTNASVWMCRQEVQTSEGAVSDTTGSAANMGHFSYLRLLGGGRKAYSSQEQQLVFLEEQRRDLGTESRRLAELDPTGQARNSTYVREHYDPSKPPLIVYTT